MRFCFYPRQELTLWVTDDGSIPIKAWGVVPLKIHEYKRQPQTPDCGKCLLQCTKGGVKLTVVEGVDAVEVISTSIKMEFSKPRREETIALPAEVIISHYSVQAVIWAMGHKITQLEANCEPNAYCEMINCYFCRALVANPHCAPKEAVIVLTIALYIVSVALYALIKLFKLLVGGLRCAGRCCSLICTLTGRCKRQSSAKRKWPLPKKLALTICLMIIQLPVARSCAATEVITAMERQCESNKEGKMSCTFEETTVIALQPVG